MEGDVVECILQTAEAKKSDLIVMATAGHEGLMDSLRGSTTEQVLRAAPCPVLAVPVD
jgi:nucleotide-binding universal stress UspA family protein